MNDATVLVIFPIALGSRPARGARLLLRLDPHGNMSAALQHDVLPAGSSDEPLRWHPAAPGDKFEPGASPVCPADDFVGGGFTDCGGRRENPVLSHGTAIAITAPCPSCTGTRHIRASQPPQHPNREYQARTPAGDAFSRRMRGGYRTSW